MFSKLVNKQVAAAPPLIEIALQGRIFIKLFGDDFPELILVFQRINIGIRIKCVEAVILRNRRMQADARHPVGIGRTADESFDLFKLI